ncbi:DUF1801 domain-containing protein [Actinomadura graeca]|uniref:DUF1801 domain-containing protein n=1 Tax=Actinomadura graeca TaxID=2750812 RepID=A0ABX8QPU2_9ACTN|nr:DUF1801 domain-containing protein [Actinomadura graeca]QXJ20819.1 DUF1801 domain-containing protein [Actinomadura graeca]
MPGDEIDAYIASELDPGYAGILDVLRTLMVAHAPGAVECLTCGSPAWRGEGILAVVSQSKSHLTFAFERGAEFRDAHGLLEGAGRSTRHIKIRDIDDIDEAALRDYIEQAVALDGGRPG